MNRNFLFLVYLAILLFLETAAHAEPPVPAQTSSELTTDSPQSSEGLDTATYFLIDVSGSMRRYFEPNADAEAAVAQHLRKLKDGPDAQVSRTYFKAANWGACGASIRIAEFKSARESRPEPQKFRSDDYTPSGEALKAAILEAVKRGGPADIVLIGDNEQTPGCGADICAVASALLPIKEINVMVIPLEGADEAGHDRMGCIAAAQNKPLVQQTSDVEQSWLDSKMSLFEQKFSREGLIKTNGNWLERWAWLLSFVAMAGGAIFLGVLDSIVSVGLENKANTARSYQKRIEDGDGGAEDKLNKLIAELPPVRATPKRPILDGIMWTLGQISKFLLLPKFWPLVSGSVGLLILTFTQPNERWWDFHFKSAQDSAWTVLNSDFSTAFAGVWLAGFYFWLTQNQRRREAGHDLAIATNEAGRIRDKLAVEANKAIRRRYTTAYDDFEIQFYVPMGLGEGEDLENFELVTQAAIDLARGTKLPDSSDEAAFIGQIDVLASLMPNWGDRRHFTKFLDRLLASHLTDGTLQTHKDEWMKVAKALSPRNTNREEVRKSLRELADKLRQVAN